MEYLQELLQRLIALGREEEWFEFKKNWFEERGVGEYISALANSAAQKRQDYGYLIWGVDDQSHEIVGTDFDFQRSVKGEPLQHFLARQLTPANLFSFHEVWLEGQRLVVLEIAKAERVPTAFAGKRYMRIGSSKVDLAKYPDREADLFFILRNQEKSMTTLESEYQDLSFTKLFTYYAGRGISLKEETFRKNLGLLTKNGRYNLLAQLLSDDSHIPIRVSIFAGKDKASPLRSVKEFGNTCILISLDKILAYADVLNFVQVDERDRVVERKEVTLFDFAALREAVINSFVHNHWVEGIAPSITFFSDRVEVMSRGTLVPEQTLEGFFLGESVPVNRRLSDIFLQLHISERLGRGIPTITQVYGKDIFEFREKSIVVNIPLHRLEQEKAPESLDFQPCELRLLNAFRNNPNLTQGEAAQMLGFSRSKIEQLISELKRAGVLRRIGSKKYGYWEVVELP